MITTAVNGLNLEWIWGQAESSVRLDFADFFFSLDPDHPVIEKAR